MVLEKPQIIDGRDHLLGRLASIVSRELLAGQSIVLVRCDEIVVSGSCECRHERCFFSVSWRFYRDVEGRFNSFLLNFSSSPIVME
jgi:ribosomal protein L13